MDAVLKKHSGGRFSLSHKESGWWIGDSDHDKVKAHKGEQILSNLSLKNCEAIERGYDLDELVESRYPIKNTGAMFMPNRHEVTNIYRQEGFIEGAKTILEILGDKKFSEEDLREAISQTRKGMLYNKKYEDEYIKSIQQTEWEVEIEMEKVKDETKIVGAVKGVKGSGNKITTYKSVPKLDADGCLILKRL